MIKISKDVRTFLINRYNHLCFLFCYMPDNILDSKFVCTLALRIFELPWKVLIIVHNFSTCLICCEYLITETYHFINSIGLCNGIITYTSIWCHLLGWLCYYMYRLEQLKVIFMCESSGGGGEGPDPHPLENSFFLIKRVKEPKICLGPHSLPPRKTPK